MSIVNARYVKNNSEKYIVNVYSQMTSETIRNAVLNGKSKVTQVYPSLNVLQLMYHELVIMSMLILKN